MRYGFAMIVGVLVALPGPASAAPAKKPDPQTEKVKKAIQAGIKYLRNQQMKDGSWEVDALSSTFPGGWTSLALLALLEAGVSPRDMMIEKGLKFLRKEELTWIYVRALQTRVFAKAGQKADAKRIQANVNWLIKNRVRDKDGNLLGWPYTEGKHTTDNSNTQYAVLGLQAGSQAGAKVLKAIWKEIREYYLRTQEGDGGWSYNKSNPELTYLTMDVAGLCGLLISGAELKIGRNKLLKEKSTQKALRLIDKLFTVKQKSKIYYNLHSIARLGRVSGLKKIGKHDWYKEGCEFLLKEQAKDGSWPSQPKEFDQWPVINTSFALLFLVK